MKPRNGFVMTMLAAFQVSHVDAIPREKINGMHANMLHNAMTETAKDFLREYCGQANKKKEPVVMTAANKELKRSNLLQTTPEERILISRIYGKLGCEMTISDDGIIIAPIKKS
jgi:hypothetical protein